MEHPVIKIQGIDFHMPKALPYHEGHQLDAAESAALNQMYAENIRNNYAARIRKAIKEAGMPEGTEATALPEEIMHKLHGEFKTFALEYKFTLRAPSVAVDPVEQEAMKIAVAAVKAKLKEKGYDAKQYAEKIPGIAQALIEKDPAILKEAKARVKARREAAERLSSTLDDLFQPAAA